MTLLAHERNAGHTYCQACRAYLSKRAAERAKGNLLREPAARGLALTVAETKAQVRANARAAGLCGVCAKRVPDPGYKTCPVCIERAALQREKKKKR
jgi:hypothetical protein